MERYLEGEEISHEEIVTALKDGTDRGHIFPVTCGVATAHLGTDRLLDAIVEDLPSPVAARRRSRLGGHDARADRGRRDVRLRLQDAAPTRSPGASTCSASTRASMTHDTHVLNTPRPPQGAHRPAAGAAGQGGRRTPTRSARATSARWPSSRRRTRATGSPTRDQPIAMPSIKLPAPVMAFAIEPKAKGDEDKVFTALRRLQEEDPTIDLHRDPQTGEQIVAGPLADPRRGDRRPDARRASAPRSTLKPPRVPYQETIRGSRQGARPPQEADRRPRPVRRLPHRDRAAARDGDGFEFVNAIKGGVIPTGLHPRGREGRAARRWQHGRRRRLPDQGRARAAVRRLLPHGRLVGDGVQDRRLDGHASRRSSRPARCCSSRSCSSPSRSPRVASAT